MKPAPALYAPVPAEPIEPWITLAMTLGQASLAAALAMFVGWLVIAVLVEVYDEAIGAPRPPAWWRRPWCWVFGHADSRADNFGAYRCTRCGAWQSWRARR